jgi:hypothetical protein
MMKRSILSAALSALFAYSGAVHASTVDLFTEPAGFPPQRLTVTPDDPGTLADESKAASQWGPSLTDPPSIIGSYRDLVLEFVSFENNNDPQARMAAGGGLLTFQAGTGVKAIGQVQWDGGSDVLDPSVLVKTGLNGANLIKQDGCGAGCNAFVTTVLEADLGFPYQIEVWDMDGNYSILTAATQFSVGSTGDVPIATADYLFEWFNFESGDYIRDLLEFNIFRPLGVVDFTRIGALQLTINSDGSGSTTAVDLSIGAITKVPEPNVLALMGIGGLVSAFAARRRKALKS